MNNQGNVHWEFDENGLMHIPDMSANDYAIKESKRRYKYKYQKIGCQNPFFICNNLSKCKFLFCLIPSMTTEFVNTHF
jgi:nuclear transport factor 2 (NTF2) superfamily protein